MKRLVYLALGLALSVGSINASRAQSFVTVSGSSDTASNFIINQSDGTITVANGIRSTAAQQPAYIRWTVTSINVPNGVSVLQFCDYPNCYPAINVGTSYISAGYPSSGFQDFHAVFTGMNTAPAYSHAYLTLTARDTISNYSRTLTFHAYKGGLGVVTTLVSDDAVNLYPNPARDAVNLVYSPAAGVKTIAIYNLIGKAIKIFRPMDDNSAKLDIDNIPTGVYFVRLMDVNGHVVATRRFTHQ